MRSPLIVLLALSAMACGRPQEQERLESLENRLQANEFQLASVSEMEPRLLNAVRMVEEKYQEWASRMESMIERVADVESRMMSVERRLEQVEEWIREEDKKEEKERIFATPDGKIPLPWKELHDKCQL